MTTLKDRMVSYFERFEAKHRERSKTAPNEQQRTYSLGRADAYQHAVITIRNQPREDDIAYLANSLSDIERQWMLDYGTPEQVPSARVKDAMIQHLLITDTGELTLSGKAVHRWLRYENGEKL